MRPKKENQSLENELERLSQPTEAELKQEDEFVSKIDRSKNSTNGRFIKTAEDTLRENFGFRSVINDPKTGAAVKRQLPCADQPLGAEGVNQNAEAENQILETERALYRKNSILSDANLDEVAYQLNGARTKAAAAVGHVLDVIQGKSTSSEDIERAKAAVHEPEIQNRINEAAHRHHGNICSQGREFDYENSSDEDEHRSLSENLASMFSIVRESSSQHSDVSSVDGQSETSDAVTAHDVTDDRAETPESESSDPTWYDYFTNSLGA